MNKIVKNKKDKNDDFFMPYFGTKNREVNEIYDVIKDDLKEIENIFEPFGGSFALIRFIYRKHLNQFNYFVSDIDDNLISVCLYLLDSSSNEYIINEIKSYKEITKEEYDKLKIKKINDINDASKYLFTHVYYCIRPGMYPKTKKVNINYDRIKNFTKYKDINLSISDAFEIIDKYKDNKKCFFFLRSSIFTYL